VIATVEWPSRWLTTFGDRPDEIIIVAELCRRPWTPIVGRPISIDRRLNDAGVAEFQPFAATPAGADCSGARAGPSRAGTSRIFNRRSQRPSLGLGSGGRCAFRHCATIRRIAEE
jgi:hypothetical protein